MTTRAITLHNASCVDWLADYDGPLFDSCVTDPPYHLTSIVKRFGKEGSAEAKVPDGGTGAYARASRGFMGKEWDGGDIAFRPETWRAIYDALKPGAHLVAFSGTRTYHRMACAIEDAGFEIRDQLFWHYGSGFPKSHDISKAIDKAAGAEREVVGVRKVPGMAKGNVEHGAQTRSKYEFAETSKNAATPEAEQWQGWGTALKPATEPICLARKPISEKNIAANVLRWGTGAINVDGCRVGTEGGTATQHGARESRTVHAFGDGLGARGGKIERVENLGRFPANLIHDNSPEVLAGFPETGAAKSGGVSGFDPGMWQGKKQAERGGHDDNGGSAARFFYSAPQDTPCVLCGMPCNMSEWNANTAESNSPTPNTPPVNTAGEAVQARHQTQSAASPKALSESAHSAECNSKQHQAQTADIAAESAPAWQLENLALNVSNAGDLCGLCATVIAQNLVALKQGQSPASLQFPASISERNAQTLRQSLALYVEGRENTDTITTIPSLKMLLGSAFLAIAENTQSTMESPSESSERSRRFWYSSKAGPLDRLGTAHATVKPVDLMRWLCRLITPPGGHILEPFAGSGTTGIAAMAEGFDCTMIELEADHAADIERKLAYLRGEGGASIIEKHKARIDRKAPEDNGPLFGGME